MTYYDIAKYNVCTKEDLSRIRIPLVALYCNEMSYSTHQADIDNFYYDIVNTVKGVLENIFLHENVSTFYCRLE